MLLTSVLLEIGPIAVFKALVAAAPTCESATPLIASSSFAPPATFKPACKTAAPVAADTPNAFPIIAPAPGTMMFSAMPITGIAAFARP